MDAALSAAGEEDGQDGEDGADEGQHERVVPGRLLHLQHGDLRQYAGALDQDEQEDAY